jgi:exopolysaccharide biosynthesis protein
MKKFGILVVLLLCTAAQAVIITVDPWTPLFKGIELGHGQQQTNMAGEKVHQVLCLRIDLTDPDVQFFATPHCTNSCGSETLSENTSHFVEQYQVQAAIDCNFYSGSGGAGDPPLGSAVDVLGLAISQGNVVSPNQINNTTHGYLLSVIMLTTNKQVVFSPSNNPAASTNGIYTAITGNETILNNGVNYGDNTTSDLDPRTAVGVSQDRHYLYMLTLDGRQPGWSDGANRYDTAEWLKRFGAWDGINVDGGGSTTMVMADCQGKAVRLNRSSFAAGNGGRERNVGHNLGVYAPPLPTDLADMTVTPGSTTATITWRTAVEATTQVEYGPTLSYGSNTPLDSRMLKNHAATLRGLTPGSNYFFRALSTTGGGQTYTQSCGFTTGISVSRTQIFGLTKSWRYTSNNLDGTSWKAIAYNDTNSTWLGGGPGLLYVVEANAAVSPRNTQMPPTGAPTSIPRTYYFRTHFDFTGTVAGASMTLSNYVDDGAVFYLNGTEIYRVRMPAAPTVITYATAASGGPCAGTAQNGDAAVQCPDIFTISGPLLTTNLVQGDNVLAVEVHNVATGTDLVFGSALFHTIPVIVPPRLTLWMENNQATLFWNGENFTLQQSGDVSSPGNWSNAPGASGQSPFSVTNGDSIFYRLRN